MSFTMPELLPCPRCGRQPVLREVRHVYGSPYGDASRLVHKVSCRKWLGLRLCFGPHKETWISTDWGDLGRQTAGEVWNTAVRAARWRR